MYPLSPTPYTQTPWTSDFTSHTLACGLICQMQTSTTTAMVTCRSKVLQNDPASADCLQVLGRSHLAATYDIGIGTLHKINPMLFFCFVFTTRLPASHVLPPPPLPVIHPFRSDSPPRHPHPSHFNVKTGFMSADLYFRELDLYTCGLNSILWVTMLPGLLGKRSGGTMANSNLS